MPDDEKPDKEPVKTHIDKVWVMQTNGGCREMIFVNGRSTEHPYNIKFVVPCDRAGEHPHPPLEDQDTVVINAENAKQSHQEQDQLTRKRGYKPSKDAELRAYVCSCGKHIEAYIPKGKSPICSKCNLPMVPAEGLG